jgi:CheY-like chemotaxis protein
MTKGPILVVDDDPTIREILLVVLEEEGYAVQMAAHGLQALTQVEATPPRVIVVDLRMPVMDGWTFVREVRARGVSAPIIVVTAAQDADRCVEEIHPDCVLAKPFDLDTFLCTIERLSEAA